MDFDSIKAGQRVRVTYEGIVEATWRGREPWIRIGFEDNSRNIVVGGGGAGVVELIEPDYVHGAMYEDAEGGFYQFEEYAPGAGTDEPGWWGPGRGAPVPFARPVRPLTRLVPESI